MGSARFSHSLQELQRYNAWPLVTTDQVDKLIDEKLPSVDEQISNLIRWMLEEVDDDFLSPIRLPDYERLAAIVGAKDGDRVHALIEHAVNEGLVQLVWENSFSLTAKGSRSMKQLMTDNLTLVTGSGEVVKSDIKGRITGTTLVTFDSSLSIKPGDRFLRRLPSGLQEEFIVEDPGYHSELPGMDAHFQAKIRRSDTPALTLQTIINNIQGANARVNIHSTDASTNISHQDKHTQTYNDLRERLTQLSVDSGTANAIRVSIDEMETAHGTPQFKEKYLEFLSISANHIGVFGPVLATLASYI